MPIEIFEVMMQENSSAPTDGDTGIGDSDAILIFEVPMILHRVQQSYKVRRILLT
jgi:hypothetical protein